MTLSTLLTILIGAGVVGGQWWSGRKSDKREAKALNLQKFLAELTTTAQKEGTAATVRNQQAEIRRNLLDIQHQNRSDAQTASEARLAESMQGHRQDMLQQVLGLVDTAGSGPSPAVTTPELQQGGARAPSLASLLGR